MVPYKHYTEDVISDSVNTNIDLSENCPGPSAATIRRWKRWIRLNRNNINGHLRSIGYRELDFSKELLKSSVSLLEELMGSIRHGWLRTILCLIYNSGTFMVPVYT